MIPLVRPLKRQVNNYKYQSDQNSADGIKRAKEILLTI